MTENGRQDELIRVEVAYGTPQRQRVIALQVEVGTTAYQALIRSGIMEHFEGIDPDGDPMGIFGKRLDGKSLPEPKEYCLQAGDRVEIYRPLVIDPKQARLARAARKDRDKE